MNSSEYYERPHSNAHVPGVIESYRSMFYLMLPSESKFDEVSEVPNYVIAASGSFISLILLEMLVSHFKGRRKVRVNDGIGSFTAGILSRLILLTSQKSMDIVFYTYIYTNWRIVDLPWDSTWAWFISLIIVDFLFYWFHRAVHEVNILWAGHQTHHSSEDYNLSTATRQSAFQGYVLMFVYLPSALFVPPAMHLVHVAFNLLFQFWIHTELIDSIGPLEYIFNTPSHHRVHHGRNPYCIDKNYGGTLIIWDRLFGTFAAEKRGVKISYGLVHNINSFNPIYIQTGYFIDLFKKTWNTGGFRHKLCVLFNGPGWSPGKPRLGNFEDIPEIKWPVKIHNPYIPSWLALYAFVHYLSVVPIYEKTMLVRYNLPASMIIFDAFFCIATLYSLGQLFDKTPYAKLCEVARCFAFLMLAIYYEQYRNNIEKSLGFSSSTGYVFIFIYSLSLLTWCWQTFFDSDCLKTKSE